VTRVGLRVDAPAAAGGPAARAGACLPRLEAEARDAFGAGRALGHAGRALDQPVGGEPARQQRGERAAEQAGAGAGERLPARRADGEALGERVEPVLGFAEALAAAVPHVVVAPLLSERSFLGRRT